MEKVCTVCNLPREVDNFHKCSGNKTGLQSYCKECARNKLKTYSLANPQKMQDRASRYKEKHKEKIQKRNKAYCKQYYLDNLDKFKEHNKSYRLENSQTASDYGKKYRQENKDKLREYWRLYAANKMNTDLNFRLKKNMRKRIWDVLTTTRKSKRTMELIGCSIEELKKHLENQFKDNMSWDNYGQWHVDHVKPCAKFDLLKEAEQLVCFNYTNLQPLWAEDNLKKHAKYVP